MEHAEHVGNQEDDEDRAHACAGPARAHLTDARKQLELFLVYDHDSE